MTLYRKYRPQKFVDVIGQNHIRDTLVQAVKEGRLSQAYLFCGPRGTGKTTTARLIAKVANCLEIEKQKNNGAEISGEPCGKCESCLEIGEGRSLDVIEIDAASNRGIDEIRQLRDQVRFAPAKAKFKVYIIDEVHMLTREAFNALLKTLEEPPSHAIFILATTEPHKVLPTIISRTQRYNFGRIKMADLIDNLENISKQEGYKTEREALELIALLADGGSRDSLSLLEQVASYSSDISSGNVRSILGIAETSQVLRLIGAIFNSEAEEGLKIARALFESGANINQLIASILNVLRKILNWQVAGEFMLDDTDDNKKNILKLCDMSKKIYSSHAISATLNIIKEFIESNKIIKETIDPLLAIEMAVIRSIESNKSQNTDENSAIPQKTIKTKNDIIIDRVVKEEFKKLDKTNELAKDKKAETKKPNATSIKEDVLEESATKEEATDNSLEPLAEISEPLWDNVISELKKENSTLAALLKDAKPIAVESGKLVLGVRFKFHKDKISEAKNVKVLEGVICSVTKNSCRVFCEIADFNAKPKQGASDDELAEEAERIFSE